MRILVTGANGFIGKHLCKSLKDRGYFVRAAMNIDDETVVCDEKIVVDNINGKIDWRKCVTNMEIIIHLANRAHVFSKTPEELIKLKEINVDGTKKLAEDAILAGVKRFIYLSSVKVNGERMINGRSFNENDIPAPEDAYGASKLAAENILNGFSKSSAMEIVILRPPLVYGAGVKANFKQLIKIASMGFPLPFASIANKRSFIYVGNLIGAIIACLENPAAKNQTFLVSDDHDLSTPELIRYLAKALGKSDRLFSFPIELLKLVAKLFGREDRLDKLIGSLQVDIKKIKTELNWRPEFTVEEGIAKTVKS